MAKYIFVTGTDTDIGKTLVASGLLNKLRQTGVTAVGYKPVSAGCKKTVDGLRNEDALLLQEESSGDYSYEEINPEAYEPAIAPSIAAEQIKKEIPLKRLIGQAKKLAESNEMVVIEGAGGWKVPLNEKHCFDDLPIELGADVLLVVGMRLGCISHALLTAQAVHSSGLGLVGWVANVLDEEMPVLMDNIETIKQHINAPLLGVIPQLKQPTASEAAKYLSL